MLTSALAVCYPADMTRADDQRERWWNQFLDRGSVILTFTKHACPVMPMKLLKLKFKCIPGSYKTAAGQVSLHHLLGKTFTLKERNFTHCIDQSLFYRLKAYVFQSYICPGVSFLDTVVLSYPWGTCSKIPSGCLKMCIVQNPT